MAFPLTVSISFLFSISVRLSLISLHVSHTLIWSRSRYSEETDVHVRTSLSSSLPAYRRFWHRQVYLELHVFPLQVRLVLLLVGVGGAVNLGRGEAVG